ncbi:uncharacterized protein LOC144124681 [Amblyomma americanum]
MAAQQFISQGLPPPLLGAQPPTVDRDRFRSAPETSQHWCSQADGNPNLPAWSPVPTQCVPSQWATAAAAAETRRDEPAQLVMPIAGAQNLAPCNSAPPGYPTAQDVPTEKGELRSKASRPRRSHRSKCDSPSPRQKDQSQKGVKCYACGSKSRKSSFKDAAQNRARRSSSPTSSKAVDRKSPQSVAAVSSKKRGETLPAVFETGPNSASARQAAAPLRRPSSYAPSKLMYPPLYEQQLPQTYLGGTFHKPMLLQTPTKMPKDFYAVNAPPTIGVNCSTFQAPPQCTNTTLMYDAKTDPAKYMYAPSALQQPHLQNQIAYNCQNNGHPFLQESSRFPLNGTTAGQVGWMPAGILRHYVSRANDGSPTWESISLTTPDVTGTSSTESSCGSKASSLGNDSRMATRTACLTVCLATAALLSFWVVYVIMNVAFGGRLSASDDGHPVTVRLQDDNAFSVLRNIFRQ